jgi:hypothetical protein
VLLKFDSVDWLLGVAAVVHIHICFSYYWLVEKNPWLKFFLIRGGLPADIWAYILASLLLGFASWKIFKAPFSERNFDAVTKYFRSLLGRQEYGFLLDLIESYFLDDIENYLLQRRDLKKHHGMDAFLSQEARSKRDIDLAKIDQLDSQSRFKYAKWVFEHILKDDLFVKARANSSPDVFLRVIRLMNTGEVDDKDFVQTFVATLMQQKNARFFQEIANCQNMGQDDTYRIPENAVFLNALIGDLKVASINGIEYGFGEPAINELENEASRPESRLRDLRRNDGTELEWNSTVRISTHLLDIIIRKAIAEDFDDYFWPLYLRDFQEALIKNVKKENLIRVEFDKTMNAKLIRETHSVIADWLQVIALTEKARHLQVILDCYVFLWDDLLKAEILPDSFMQDLFDLFVSQIIELRHAGDNSKFVDELIPKIWKSLLGDGYHLAYRKYEQDPHITRYVQLLETVWARRDLPSLNGYRGERMNLFEQIVLNPIREFIRSQQSNDYI